MKSPDITNCIRRSMILLLTTLLSLPVSWGQETSTDRTSVSITEKNQQREITINRNGTKFSVQINGFITLADDDTDVVAISGGGYLKISKSAFGTKRRLEIEADRNGQLIRKYYVGWREQNYEPEGREWLAEVLPEIVRSSGVGAEDRVNRIYDQGGMGAIATEIGLLDGDYVKSTYLKLLLCKDLSDGEVNRVVSLMGEEIESDYYLTELLTENFGLFTESEERLNTYIAACSQIESDHYLTEVLQATVRSQRVADAQLRQVLQAAEGIESDHYLASLLVDMLENREMNSANLDALLRVGRQIESDHYQTEVLEKALSTKQLSDATFNRLLDNINEIESDHYVAEVITGLLEDRSISEPVSRKLLEIIERNVASDHYQAECLIEYVENDHLTSATLASFLAAMRSVDSDNYFVDVMEEVADLGILTNGDMVEVLNACGEVDSDNYLADCLGHFADTVRARGGAVRDAYLAVAKNIDSETYYGRALKALE